MNYQKILESPRENKQTPHTKLAASMPPSHIKKSNQISRKILNCNTEDENRGDPDPTLFLSTNQSAQKIKEKMGGLKQQQEGLA